MVTVDIPTSPRPLKLTPVAMAGIPTTSRPPPLTPMVEMEVVMVAAFTRARLLRRRLMTAVEEGTAGIPIRRLTPLMFLMVEMAIEYLSSER